MTDRAFVPGWLPQGWKRGDPLLVINERFRKGPQAALMLAGAGMLPVELVSPTATVQFHEDQLLLVLEWLRWFCFACDYLDIASRI